MGVDTKGFVLTPVKDANIILALAAGALNNLICEEARLDPRTKGKRPWTDEYKELYHTTEVRIHPDTPSGTLNFKFKGVDRMISIHFRCDCDHKDYGPRSISWSMGAHGDSVLLVKQVGFALSLLGEVYITPVDSRDETHPLPDRPLTVAQAVKLGYLSVLNMGMVFEELERHGYSRGQLIQVMGSQLADMTAESLENATYEELKSMVAGAEERMPHHLSEHHQQMAMEAMA